MAVHFDLLELYHFDNVVLLSVLVLRRLGLTAVSVVNFNLLEFYLGAPGSGPQARDYDRRGRISASRWFWPGRTPDAKPDVDLSTGSSMRSDHGLRLLKISLDLGRPPGWDAGPGCIRPPFAGTTWTDRRWVRCSVSAARRPGERPGLPLGH